MAIFPIDQTILGRTVATAYILLEKQKLDTTNANNNLAENSARFVIDLSGIKARYHSKFINIDHSPNKFKIRCSWQVLLLNILKLLF